MLCFTKVPVAKKFMNKWGAGGEMKYKNYPSNVFLSQSAKNFVRGPLSDSLNSAIEQC